jgi:hypothetical protein
LVQILRNPKTWAHLLEPELVKLLGRYSPGTNWKQIAKTKMLFENSEWGILRGEKRAVASFKVKKTRS